MSGVDEIITNLQEIIKTSTYDLQNVQNGTLSSEYKSNLETINTNANNTLIQFLEDKNNRNTQVTDTYIKSIEATNFINDAKGILKRIFYENKNKLKELETTNSTQMKQIQFNNYFSQKYNYNVRIMKILVTTSILVMICILLHTRDVIPDFIYTILLSVIISISMIIIITMLFSESLRSKTDFNEFESWIIT
jgi:hypothetical protein